MASKDDSKRIATTRPARRRGMTKSQIRAERRQRSESRKKRRRTIYIAGGSILAIVFILSLTLSPGLGNSTSSTAHQGGEGNINTGGPVPLDPDAGRDHIAAGVQGTGYLTAPATSGPHWFSDETPAGVPAPARWGIYEDPIPDEVLIHNLEHGGIGFHYDCPDGCDDIVSQLEDILPRNKAQFIMSPYSGINDGNSKIAITAWRHHIFMDEVDEAQILEFIDAYQDRAPESIPGNQF